jgi:hypothetical protein
LSYGRCRCGAGTWLRFWDKVRVGDGCWEWSGACDVYGYGAFWIDGRFRRAHRMAWTMQRGAIDDGLYVCHTCDNRKCVRPSHLFLGTHLDNIADMVSKGRNKSEISAEFQFKTGQEHPLAKLNPDIVRAIRADRRAGMTWQSLAEKHGVGVGTCRSVVSGRNWGHVPEEVGR